MDGNSQSPAVVVHWSVRYRTPKTLWRIRVRSAHHGKTAPMEPMFLRDVEENPAEKSAFTDLIRMARQSGAAYPQIWHMFAFLPKATSHLARFTQEIMREPAPLTPGIRELIAAYTSYRNDCPF